MTTLSLALSSLLIIALLWLLLPFLKSAEAPRPQSHQRMIAGVALFVPLFSLGLYAWLGTPQFADMQRPQPPAPMITLVDKLEQKLAQNPLDLEGWLLLARSHSVTRDYAKAVVAYEKALALAPDHIQIALALADSLTLQNGGRITARARELLQSAYQRNPHDNTTLWMLGMAEQQAGNPVAAGRYWQTLYAQLPEGSEQRLEVAKWLAGLPENAPTRPVQTPSPQTPPAQDPALSAEYAFELKIDPTLSTQWGDAQVFVYVKAANGQPMPIAARKFTLPALPSDLVLNAADELLPTRRLSDFTAVMVGIKISDAAGNVLFKSEQAGSKARKNVFIIKP